MLDDGLLVINHGSTGASGGLARRCSRPQLQASKGKEWRSARTTTTREALINHGGTETTEKTARKLREDRRLAFCRLYSVLSVSPWLITASLRAAEKTKAPVRPGLGGADTA